MTKIKICGLFRDQDIDYVNEAMPDYAGFILHFPRSHRNVSVEQAKILRKRLHLKIRPVCVFVDQPVETVINTVEELNPAVIQLHGGESNCYITELKRMTGLEIWKAFRVRDASDLRTAAECSADMVLLDNGYGTGQAFDWKNAEAFSRPYILAGGLTPDNIPEAMARLHPSVIDISTGVETNCRKDRDKIFKAVQAVRSE